MLHVLMTARATNWQDPRRLTRVSQEGSEAQSMPLFAQDNTSTQGTQLTNNDCEHG